MWANNEFRSEKKVTMTPEYLSQETLHTIPLDSGSPPPWNNDSHSRPTLVREGVKGKMRPFLYLSEAINPCKIRLFSQPHCNGEPAIATVVHKGNYSKRSLSLQAFRLSSPLCEEQLIGK